MNEREKECIHFFHIFKLSKKLDICTWFKADDLEECFPKDLQIKRLKFIIPTQDFIYTTNVNTTMFFFLNLHIPMTRNDEIRCHGKKVLTLMSDFCLLYMVKQNDKDLV